MYILWKKAAKRVWKLLNIVLKSCLCVWYLWLSSRPTSSTASVSELSRSVTHTAVPSTQCNSEKRPLSNGVVFRTLFKWHRYCGILKVHIIRKINTGIRYEPVYRPALIHVNIPQCTEVFSQTYQATVLPWNRSSILTHIIWILTSFASELLKHRQWLADNLHIQYNINNMGKRSCVYQYLSILSVTQQLMVNCVHLNNTDW